MHTEKVPGLDYVHVHNVSRRLGNAVRGMLKVVCSTQSIENLLRYLARSKLRSEEPK